MLEDEVRTAGRSSERKIWHLKRFAIGEKDERSGGISAGETKQAVGEEEDRSAYPNE
jgi:hypothetical protein